MRRIEKVGFRDKHTNRYLPIGSDMSDMSLDNEEIQTCQKYMYLGTFCYVTTL